MTHAASLWQSRRAAVVAGGACLVLGLVYILSSTDAAARTKSAATSIRWAWPSSVPLEVEQLPLYSSSSSDAKDSDRLAYRLHLERTTSPRTQRIHSPTLTFDHIYVLSLPTRLDRRHEMLHLARAHGLELTFVDAVNKSEPFIKWIAEQAAHVRPERLEIMVRGRAGSPAVGACHFMLT